VIASRFPSRYNRFGVGVGLAFSSSLCDRMMLRHPSTYLRTRLGEGCFSTAFGAPATSLSSAWNNPADLGSDDNDVAGAPAVP